MAKNSYQKLKESQTRLAAELVLIWKDGDWEGMNPVVREAFDVLGITRDPYLETMEECRIFKEREKNDD